MEHFAENYKSYLMVAFLGVQVGVLITGILWALSNEIQFKDLKKWYDEYKK